MSDGFVTHAELHAQVQELRRERQDGDQMISAQLAQHQNQHAAEHGKIDAWFLRIESKQDQLLDSVNLNRIQAERRSGSEAALLRMAMLLGPLVGVIIAYLLTLL